VFEAQRRVARGESLLIVEGELSHDQGATSLLAARFQSLERSAAADAVPARNFH
jgi:hypothetical protein